MVHGGVQNESGYDMDCSLLPLFELGSVQRAQYLLNIRLPSSSQDSTSTSAMKNDLRKLKEISVYVSVRVELVSFSQLCHKTVYITKWFVLCSSSWVTL